MGGRLTAVAALLLAAILLSGCNGSKETDQVAYVVGIGLDKAEDRKIRVTYQLAIPRILGGEKSDGSESTTSIITLKTANLAEAYNLIGTQVSRSTNTAHARMFIIGSELAKEGVGDFIASFTRYREFRGTMYFLTVKDGTAEEFIGSLKSVLEVLPSKYVEGMMLTAEESGYYAPTFIHHFVTRLKGGTAAPYTALVAVNPMTGRDRPSNPKISGERAEEYTAGNTPVTGKAVPANFAGSALYREGKLVGTLTTNETRMAEILQGRLKRSFLPLTDPLAPDEAVNVRFRLKEKPQIRAALQEGRFHVMVHLEGEITSIPSGIHYEAPEFSKRLEDQVSAYVHDHIMQMIVKTQELKCDVAGFGYSARHLYYSYPEWRKASATWNEEYGRAEIAVEVKTSLRRTGLLWQTRPNFRDQSGQ